jgi:hypothetical protein
MIIWLLYPLIEALIQSKLIAKGWKPIYFQLFVIRGMVSIGHGIFVGVENMAQYGLLVAFQACTFWILFDLLLNKFRGKPWYYLGKESGWLDRMGSKDGSFFIGLYWALKIIAFFVSILTLVLL